MDIRIVDETVETSSLMMERVLIRISYKKNESTILLKISHSFNAFDNVDNIAFSL